MNVIYTSFLTLLLLTSFDYSIQAQLIDLKEKNCKIIAHRDSTISSNNNIIQLDFVFDNTFLVSSYNFFNKNPYKNMDFPIITESTKFLRYSSNNEVLRKKGNIDFNLCNASIVKVQKEIPHNLDTNFSKYYFGFATTRCDHKIFTNKAIVNYYISISGTEDTLSGYGTQLFLGDYLYVLNSLGEIEYNVIGENFAVTYPNIDIANNLLIFRTTKMQSNKGVDGFQIHDLTYQIPIYKYEFDTTCIVHEPIYGKGDYVLFDVRNDETQLFKLFIFDLKNKRIYHKYFPENNKYPYLELSNENILLGTMIGNDAEGYLVYDTIRISEIIKNNR